jgi:hypothetical protein
VYQQRRPGQLPPDTFRLVESNTLVRLPIMRPAQSRHLPRMLWLRIHSVQEGHLGRSGSARRVLVAATASASRGAGEDHRSPSWAISSVKRTSCRVLLTEIVVTVAGHAVDSTRG